MREITIDLYEILDTVASAEDYGYDDDVLLSWLGGCIDILTDDEIELSFIWCSIDSVGSIGQQKMSS